MTGPFVEVAVESYAGYKAEETPRAFILEGRRYEVARVVDRWYEGGLDPRDQKIDYYKVVTVEGLVFILRYLYLFDSWSARARPER
ncbi:MAG: hypothetical protein AB1896_01600 [Thermodesulfobacteriota bacterium]